MYNKTPPFSVEMSFFEDLLNKGNNRCLIVDKETMNDKFLIFLRDRSEDGDFFIVAKLLSSKIVNDINPESSLKMLRTLLSENYFEAIHKHPFGPDISIDTLLQNPAYRLAYQSKNEKAGVEFIEKKLYEIILSTVLRTNLSGFAHVLFENNGFNTNMGILGLKEKDQFVLYLLSEWQPFFIKADS